MAGGAIGHAQCPPSGSGGGNTGDVLVNNGTSTGCNNSSVTIDSTGKNVTVPGTLAFPNSSNKNAYANLSFSNFAALKAFDNLGLECGSGVGSYGLLVQNASTGILSHVHVGGCQYPLELDGAPAAEPNNTYTFIPPYYPSANTSTNIVIFGGETTCDGNSTDDDKCPYLVHAGDSSSGMLFAFNLESNNNLSYCTEGPASTYCPLLIEPQSDSSAFWTIRNLLGTASAPYINTPAQVNSDTFSVTCGKLTSSARSINGFITHC